MNIRIGAGKFLIRLGKIVESMAIMAMRPDDLVEYSRNFYARPESVDGWSQAAVVDGGLTEQETALLEKVPPRQGRLLLLGVGGGREAIPLARMGFEVTGVDFVPELVRRAQENAVRRGVKIGGLVQEISSIDVPAGSFAVAWLCAAMYSCVPTRNRRIRMLQKIGRALTPGGHFVCQFHWDPKVEFPRFVERLRKMFAGLTFGNLRYEKGDMLLFNREFIHAFSSEAELRSEFHEGGFTVVDIHIARDIRRGGAVLRI